MVDRPEPQKFRGVYQRSLSKGDTLEIELWRDGDKTKPVELSLVFVDAQSIEDLREDVLSLEAEDEEDQPI
jgi:hypothetical protein